MSGDILMVNGNECLNSRGESVLKFSQFFTRKLETMKEKNYTLKSAKVNFVVYWLKEGAEHEVLIFLPELYFERISAV